MGFFERLRESEIDRGVREYEAAAGAILLDVRRPEEYREGRIPGSRNLPLDDLGRIGEMVPDRNTALYLYCRSGARSARAAGALRRMGYRRVKDLGGILNWSGRPER